MNRESLEIDTTYRGITGTTTRKVLFVGTEDAAKSKYPTLTWGCSVFKRAGNSKTVVVYKQNGAECVLSLKTFLSWVHEMAKEKTI